MDELTEPHSERHSLYFGIKEEAASESFSEVKPGLVVIKLEPKGEIDPEPDGAVDPEPDGEIDPLALNTEDDDPVVEPEDLPCPIAFLAVESKSEDSTWDNATAAVKMEMEAQTRGDEYGVHLEELDGVGKMTWNGCVEVKRRKRGRPKKHGYLGQEEKLAKQRERNRLRKRRYRASKSDEAVERERERNRLYMRRIRASLTDNEIDSRRERDRTHKRMSFVSITPELCAEEDIEMWHENSRKNKRKPVIALTPQQLERQRERNRLYMRKVRASLSGEELELRRQRDRVLKRKTREIVKQQKQGVTFQEGEQAVGSQAVQEMLHRTDFWHYAAFVKEQNLLHLNLRPTITGDNVDSIHEDLELGVKSEEEEEDDDDDDDDEEEEEDEDDEILCKREQI